MNKLYKLLKRNDDCVLLERIDRYRCYKVVDIENDVIYMGNDLDEAERWFDLYNINIVRNERKREFERWLKKFAEA